MAMVDFANVLVFGESDGQTLSQMTFQLLGIGRRIADASGQELHLFVLGAEAKEGAEEGIFCGADKVYMATHPLLEHYTADAYLLAMEQIISMERPDIVLFGQNDKGMDLAPRLAFRLKTSICLDCIDLQIDEGTKSLKQVKPVFGGKAECHYYAKGTKPQIVTIRDRAFEPAVNDESRTGEFLRIPLTLDVSKVRMRLLEKQEDDSQSYAQRLLSAKAVVSGGRGLGGKEGFDRLKKTAEILEGTIAGSRPSVDYGWVHNALQVGLTGKKIAPEVYFAIGISGAIQHMAGCLKSKTIVAINTDENAPIFQHAHYAVVGNYMDVLRGFDDECIKLREK
jgi:electron transfer flavoprotein alpha subunit